MTPEFEKTLQFLRTEIRELQVKRDVILAIKNGRPNKHTEFPAFVEDDEGIFHATLELLAS